MRNFLLFLLLTGTLTVSAGDSTVRFRQGTLIPKFTQDKPETEAGSAAAAKNSPAWAVLNVTLDEGRGISIFDYALEQNGTSYPCIGIAEGGKPFGKITAVDKNAAGRNYRLLFAVPSKDSEYGLKFQLIPGQDWNIKLNTPPPPPPKPVEEPKPPEEAKPAAEAKPAEAPAPVKAPEQTKPVPPPAPKKTEPPAVAKKAVAPINKAVAKQAASVKPSVNKAPAKATPAKNTAQAAPAKTPAKNTAQAAPAKTTPQKETAKKDKKKEKKKKKIIRK